MKYFFLAEGWHYQRVWELGGLWDSNLRRREPQIQRLKIAILEHGQNLWLYQVEDAVLMVEVKPLPEKAEAFPTIGQVFIKRLMTAEQVLQHLNTVEAIQLA